VIGAPPEEIRSGTGRTVLPIRPLGRADRQDAGRKGGRQAPALICPLAPDAGFSVGRRGSFPDLVRGRHPSPGMPAAVRKECCAGSRNGKTTPCRRSRKMAAGNFPCRRAKPRKIVTVDNDQLSVPTGISGRFARSSGKSRPGCRPAPPPARSRPLQIMAQEGADVQRLRLAPRPAADRPCRPPAVGNFGNRSVGGMCPRPAQSSPEMRFPAPGARPALTTPTGFSDRFRLAGRLESPGR